MPDTIDAYFRVLTLRLALTQMLIFGLFMKLCKAIGQKLNTLFLVMVGSRNERCSFPFFETFYPGLCLGLAEGIVDDFFLKRTVFKMLGQKVAAKNIVGLNASLKFSSSFALRKINPLRLFLLAKNFLDELLFILLFHFFSPRVIFLECVVFCSVETHLLCWLIQLEKIGMGCMFCSFVFLHIFVGNLLQYNDRRDF